MSLKKKVLIVIVVIMAVAGLYEWSTFFPKKITSFYNNTASRISSVQISGGSNGGTKVINDKDTINLITNYLGGITLRKQNTQHQCRGWRK